MADRVYLIHEGVVALFPETCASRRRQRDNSHSHESRSSRSHAPSSGAADGDSHVPPDTKITAGASPVVQISKEAAMVMSGKTKQASAPISGELLARTPSGIPEGNVDEDRASMALIENAQSVGHLGSVRHSPASHSETDLAFQSSPKAASADAKEGGVLPSDLPTAMAPVGAASTSLSELHTQSNAFGFAASSQKAIHAASFHAGEDAMRHFEGCVLDRDSAIDMSLWRSLKGQFDVFGFEKFALNLLPRTLLEQLRNALPDNAQVDALYRPLPRPGQGSQNGHPGLYQRSDSFMSDSAESSHMVEVRTHSATDIAAALQTRQHRAHSKSANGPDDLYWCFACAGDMLAMTRARRPFSCEVLVEVEMLSLGAIECAQFLIRHSDHAAAITACWGFAFGEMIREVPLFRNVGLSPSHLCLLTYATQCLKLLEKEELFAENDFEPEGNPMYIVVQGKVGAVTVTIDSAGAPMVSRLLNTFSPGSCFGEIGLGIHIPRTATCIAFEDSLLLSLQRRDFDRFLKIAKNPKIEAELKKLVTERIAGSLRKHRVPFFSAIPDEAYEQLAALCNLEFVKQGTYLLRAGQRSMHFYMLANGEVALIPRSTDTQAKHPSNALTDESGQATPLVASPETSDPPSPVVGAEAPQRASIAVSAGGTTIAAGVSQFDSVADVELFEDDEYDEDEFESELDSKPSFFEAKETSRTDSVTAESQDSTCGARCLECDVDASPRRSPTAEDHESRGSRSSLTQDTPRRLRKKSSTAVPPSSSDASPSKPSFFARLFGCCAGEPNIHLSNTPTGQNVQNSTSKGSEPIALDDLHSRKHEDLPRRRRHRRSMDYRCIHEGHMGHVCNALTALINRPGSAMGFEGSGNDDGSLARTRRRSQRSIQMARTYSDDPGSQRNVDVDQISEFLGTIHRKHRPARRKIGIATPYTAGAGSTESPTSTPSTKPQRPRRKSKIGSLVVPDAQTSNVTSGEPEFLVQRLSHAGRSDTARRSGRTLPQIMGSHGQSSSNLVSSPSTLSSRSLTHAPSSVTTGTAITASPSPPVQKYGGSAAVLARLVASGVATLGTRGYAEMRPGMYFGEASLLEERDSECDVIALSNCVVLSLSKDRFHEFLRIVPLAAQDLTIQLQHHATPLSAVLRHPVGDALFRKYVESEYAAENLWFWHTVELFRNRAHLMNDAELVTCAIYIVRDFIAPAAKWAIAVTEAQQRYIIAQVAAGISPSNEEESSLMTSEEDNLLRFNSDSDDAPVSHFGETTLCFGESPLATQDAYQLVQHVGTNLPKSARGNNAVVLSQSNSSAGQSIGTIVTSHAGSATQVEVSRGSTFASNTDQRGSTSHTQLVKIAAKSGVVSNSATPLQLFPSANTIGVKGSSYSSGKNTGMLSKSSATTSHPMTNRTIKLIGNRINPSVQKAGYSKHVSSHADGAYIVSSNEFDSDLPPATESAMDLSPAPLSLKDFAKNAKAPNTEQRQRFPVLRYMSLTQVPRGTQRTLDAFNISRPRAKSGSSSDPMSWSGTRLAHAHHTGLWGSRTQRTYSLLRKDPSNKSAKNDTSTTAQSEGSQVQSSTLSSPSMQLGQLSLDSSEDTLEVTTAAGSSMEVRGNTDGLANNIATSDAQLLQDTAPAPPAAPRVNVELITCALNSIASCLDGSNGPNAPSMEGEVSGVDKIQVVDFYAAESSDLRVQLMRLRRALSGTETESPNGTEIGDSTTNMVTQRQREVARFVQQRDHLAYFVTTISSCTGVSVLFPHSRLKNENTFSFSNTQDADLISDALEREISQHPVKPIPRNEFIKIFDPLQRSTYDLMTHSSFMRFKRTEMFEQFIAQLSTYAQNEQQEGSPTSMPTSITSLTHLRDKPGSSQTITSALALTSKPQRSLKAAGSVQSAANRSTKSATPTPTAPNRSSDSSSDSSLAKRESASSAQAKTSSADGSHLQSPQSVTPSQALSQDLAGKMEGSVGTYSTPRLDVPADTRDSSGDSFSIAVTITLASPPSGDGNDPKGGQGAPSENNDGTITESVNTISAPASVCDGTSGGNNSIGPAAQPPHQPGLKRAPSSNQSVVGGPTYTTAASWIMRSASLHSPRAASRSLRATDSLVIPSVAVPVGAPDSSDYDRKALTSRAYVARQSSVPFAAGAAGPVSAGDKSQIMTSVRSQRRSLSGLEQDVAMSTHGPIIRRGFSLPPAIQNLSESSLSTNPSMPMATPIESGTWRRLGQLQNDINAAVSVPSVGSSHSLISEKPHHQRSSSYRGFDKLEVILTGTQRDTAQGGVPALSDDLQGDSGESRFCAPSQLGTDRSPGRDLSSLPMPADAEGQQEYDSEEDEANGDVDKARHPVANLRETQTVEEVDHEEDFDEEEDEEEDDDDYDDDYENDDEHGEDHAMLHRAGRRRRRKNLVQGRTGGNLEPSLSSVSHTSNWLNSESKSAAIQFMERQIMSARVNRTGNSNLTTSFARSNRKRGTMTTRLGDGTTDLTWSTLSISQTGAHSGLSTPHLSTAMRGMSDPMRVRTLVPPHHHAPPTRQDPSPRD